MDFAQNLKSAMNSKSMTMYRLAKELGVHQSTIKNWLEGKGEPRISEVQDIADALGVDFYSLATWDQATKALEDRIKARDRVNAALDQMNEMGMERVADYAEDILPRYRGTPTQEREKNAPAPEGKATTTDGQGTPPERK